MPWGTDLLKPCGTPAAARRHQRRHQPLCDACATAQRVERAGRKDVMVGLRTADYRPIRNGIPWRPYRYRGSGRDAYDGSDLFEEAS